MFSSILSSSEEATIRRIYSYKKHEAGASVLSVHRKDCAEPLPNGKIKWGKAMEILGFDFKGS